MKTKANAKIKKSIFFSIFCVASLIAKGQVMSSDNLLTMAGLAKPKLESYISKRGFVYKGKDQVKDTLQGRYDYLKIKKEKDKKIDSITRSFFLEDVQGTSLIAYQTSSFPEFNALVEQFKKDGFYCNQPADSVEKEVLLFQHNDITVRTFFTVADTIKSYGLRVQKKLFPNPKEVNYADDLLAFTSHEYLAYYFGKNNVKNDVYFFSENEVARCSVLFLNTNRQVVFIWKDDVNKCTIDHLLFGGQQKLESLKQNDNFIAESNWIFKSGIHPGMSLFELRRLHGFDFKFCGGNSANSGSVLPDNAGKLNFKRENIILSCINCNDQKFASAAVIDADDAITDEKILFVLTIALNP